MADRAFNHPKIEFIWDSVVTDILDSQKTAVLQVRVLPGPAVPDQPEPHKSPHWNLRSQSLK